MVNSLIILNIEPGKIPFKGMILVGVFRETELMEQGWDGWTDDRDIDEHIEREMVRKRQTTETQVNTYRERG